MSNKNFLKQAAIAADRHQYADVILKSLLKQINCLLQEKKLTIVMSRIHDEVSIELKEDKDVKAVEREDG